MKVMALYLPQYHQIPENDEWWGEGYTEWVAVKSAKKYYTEHNQPRIPLNGRYYDLVKNGEETWRWQADLMKKYHVNGLCIYHYWFNGKMLLEKPMEILLQKQEIDLKYCVCWANETWSRNWDGGFNKVLIDQTYGDEKDTINHFYYLLPFFKDDRYIKIDNKPMMHLYKSRNIPELEKMIKCWDRLAIESGFSGIYWVSAITSDINDYRNELFEHYYYFEPGYTLKHDMPASVRLPYLIKGFLKHFYNTRFSGHKVERIISAVSTWKRIEERKVISKVSPGTFVGWDNTPRRKERGTIFENSTPNRFEKDLRLIKEKYMDEEFLYINAWNEWGEGTYLEPDETDKYGYLEAISKVMD